MKKREVGPVEGLCKEIGFRFDMLMERQDIFLAFVSVLVQQVTRMRGIQYQIAGMTGAPPSDDSADVLKLVQDLLVTNIDEMIEKAATVHACIDEVNPEDASPCDHLIDMLSSCVSAVRFGLETPCRSRHAAAAAQHIWKHLYGVTLFDSFTPNWENEWARAQLQTAILQLSVCEGESE